ncbi:FabD/lysophospholipase-like protein [Westerdykella ornata]|uniref:FabD/lysophospholipase-like protein n=1 Tax=Westerdykella ornata TaxID=318751 RepID=A0A6A6J6T8_WESOR|nr:FabD/lysophospholipase-like protein [Westerdykella ornata]KAF2272115.1 FabD/lysophospholipase-like protein [Westerdykella ornata]
MLRPPNIDPPQRPLSIMTTATSASGQDKTGATWATAVTDENAWEDLILTLDGGGIRGYASLLILKRLVHEIVKCERRLQETEGPIKDSPRQSFNEDELLLCHYFDYMYGTSTGGLISVMLGRLRMTVPQCLEIYRQVGNDLFGHRRNVLPLATKYRHKPLEKAVQRIVKEYCKHHENCDGLDWHPWNVDEKDAPTSSSASTTGETYRICQSICLTATRSGQLDEAYLLRTYDHRYDPEICPIWLTPYNEGADKLKIWQVTRATSAAPFFFKMLEADFGPQRGKVGFKDGGIRENNPSYAAYSEHASLRGDDHEPALLLSVGTGRPDTSHDGFAAAWPGPFGKVPLVKQWSEKIAVFKNLLIKYTEGEDRHKMMRTIAKGEHRWYKRLNVNKGLENMKMDHWESGHWTDPSTGIKKVVPGGKSLTRMEEATHAYLDRNEADKTLLEYQPPKVVLQQVAERLVRHRRAREATKHQDLKRWETHMGQYLTGTRVDHEDGAVKK